MVSADDGGRIASLVIDGLELLAPDTGDGPLTWGCFAMVPWAGRIRDARFSFEGAGYEMPRTLGKHALHGVGYDRPWEEMTDGRLGLDLSAPWPFGGRATQSFSISDDAMQMTVRLEAGDRPMPVVLGWHPCLRRVLARGRAAELSFDPEWMWLRAPDGVPDGTRVDPPPPPWDDTFGGCTTPPIVHWPGAMQLVLESNCPAWTVYNERIDQICVEPQTSIPNAFNFDDPPTLRAGESTELTLTLRWSFTA